MSGSYQMDTCARAGGLGCRQVGWPLTQPFPLAHSGPDPPTRKQVQFPSSSISRSIARGLILIESYSSSVCSQLVASRGDTRPRGNTHTHTHAFVKLSLQPTPNPDLNPNLSLPKYFNCHPNNTIHFNC